MNRIYRDHQIEITDRDVVAGGVPYRYDELSDLRVGDATRVWRMFVGCVVLAVQVLAIQAYQMGLVLPLFGAFLIAVGAYVLLTESRHIWQLSARCGDKKVVLYHSPQRMRIDSVRALYTHQLNARLATSAA